MMGIGRVGKRIIYSIIAVIIIFALVFCVRFFSGEDNWIKDSKGLWVKHGNPASTPSYVEEQINAIECAGELYAAESLKNISFSSQCLGICGNYSVDIVHVPRTSEDNLVENQCRDFIDKRTRYFIELNAKGEIVRVVD